MSPRTFPQSLRDFVTLFHSRFRATRCPQVAGSLAFTTLLALVPFITVTIAAFGHLPGMDAIGASLKTFLLENMLPDKAGNIITTYALEFSEKAAGLTMIGSVMLAVTSLMLLATIERVFNHIWGVRQPRPLLLRVTVYWFVLTLGPAILGGSIVATGYLVSASMQWAPNLGWLGGITARLLPPLLLGALFIFLYFAVPNHKVRFTHAAIGGVAAALVFFLMQRAFGIFIARFPTYTLVYGAFAALPIFLVWLYLSWIVVLLGALTAATLPAFAERRRLVAAFPGCEAWAAATMLVQLARAQKTGRPVSFAGLRNHAPLSEHHAEAVLGRLAEAHWVSRTDDGDWVLTRSPAQIPLAAIIRCFALDAEAWKQAAGAPEKETEDRFVQHLEDGLRFGDETLADLAAHHLA
ncbi:MAG: YihY family inner membrane protein [Azoarcus sp.]|jgi:membrane protein|nr:YihY family inner membrane protein [Azoarcus sp.]